MTASRHGGVLYLVATPIGNLEDISARARRILAAVDLVAAEDTRHSKRLLAALGIRTPLRAYHNFNEDKAARHLIKLLKAGRDVALISDAGTPLISDPGYRLLSLAHAEGLPVVPVPGPSALICALSAAGLPTSRFAFEGFAPQKRAARLEYFSALKHEPRTLVFYEAPQRIVHCLEDASSAFGETRPAALARELTKRFETIKRAELAQLLAFVQADAQQQKGEFVVLIGAAQSPPNADTQEARRVLRILLRVLGLRQAATLAAALTGQGKNALYELALEIKREIQRTGPDAEDS